MVDLKSLRALHVQHWLMTFSQPILTVTHPAIRITAVAYSAK